MISASGELKVLHRHGIGTRQRRLSLVAGYASPPKPEPPPPLPEPGTVGDGYDNAVIKSLWGRLQTELLNRPKWRTRIELSTALFEYLEIFHNRTPRHSSLGMLNP